MARITQADRDALPSNRQLLKAVALAIGAAVVVLFTAVLPAEYGIDPTGIGGRVGLTRMSAGPKAMPSRTVDANGFDPSLSLGSASPLNAVWKSASAFRTDEMSLTLQPGEGAEIKADMKAGERFVFTWTADGGPVSFDMHGEKTGASSDDFSSYWKGRSQGAAHGEFQAPFSGRHGWYWRNRGETPVTIHVRTSGFYGRLYRP